MTKISEDVLKRYGWKCIKSDAQAINLIRREIKYITKQKQRNKDLNLDLNLDLKYLLDIKKDNFYIFVKSKKSLHSICVLQKK
jgi:hypothetical protein